MNVSKCTIPLSESDRIEPYQPYHRGLVQYAHLRLQNLETQDTPVLVIISVTVLVIINNNI